MTEPEPRASRASRASRAPARPQQNLGAFLRSQRLVAALSLRQLAAMTSVSNAYLSQIERGLHQPSLRVLQSLARALDVRADVLLAHAGLDIPPGDPALTSTETSSTETSPTAAAIAADPDLDEDAKHVLLQMYGQLRRRDDQKTRTRRTRSPRRLA